MSEESLRTAIHEVGHALMYFSRFPGQPFHVDLEGDRQAVARFHTDLSPQQMQDQDLEVQFLQQLLWVIVGGEVAEYLVFGNVDGIAVRLDHWAFAKYAGLYLQKLPHPEYKADPANYHEAELSANAVDVVHKEYWQRTLAVLQTHPEILQQAAGELLRSRTLTHESLHKLMRSGPVN